ncbi:hypothetical protein LTR36_000437 [Oleoguttula mirabilis]|uniref:Nuc-1 negative regulatory protein preg n=1 Tax=Oleoguttula mirabilis TaxID=1507867 RepID=A0AAV9JYS1_9PEZI|nr:hypothetical protein LTR36_000437 [Oleoguttula mirabilis]
MSTLTHSPSPAASPRAFHPRHYSPRASPRPYPGSGPSPPRASNAPAPTSSSKPPKHHLPTAPQAVALAPRRHVDAGTQYSPDGYPPTAGRAYTVAAGGAPTQPPGAAEAEADAPSAGAGAGARKRKGSTRSESPPLTQMSGPSTAASAEAAQPGPALPREPQPPTDPAPAPACLPDGSTADLPQRSAAPQQPEPQEARSTHGHSSAPKRPRSEPGTVKIMPRQYWTCNPKDLGVLISNMLMELIRLNDQIPLRDGRLTRFHSRAPPGISVSDYLQRLIQHATLSPPIMLSMVYYIDRLCALYPAFTINSLTVHRFLITAGTVAAKGLSDSFWTNPTYARIGGIPVSELATLELEFLQKVQWKIVPKPEVLEEYYRSLVDRTEGFELEASGSDSSSLDESDEVGQRSGDETNEDDRMVDEPT